MRDPAQRRKLSSRVCTRSGSRPGHEGVEDASVTGSETWTSYSKIVCFKGRFSGMVAVLCGSDVSGACMCTFRAFADILINEDLIVSARYGGPISTHRFRSTSLRLDELVGLLTRW